MRAAHQGAQAGTQFMQIDRLDHIVVGAQVQAADAVRHGVTRGQHQHRGADLAGPQRLQHVQSVLQRQAEIEYRRRVVARRQLALGGQAVTHPVHLETQLTQAGPQSVAQHGIIFSQQNTHQKAPNGDTPLLVTGWTLDAIARARASRRLHGWTHVR